MSIVDKLPQSALKYPLKKVRRLCMACCGMENDRVYEARVGGAYAWVHLPDGKWTDHHAFEGFFEIVDDSTILSGESGEGGESK